MLHPATSAMWKTTDRYVAAHAGISARLIGCFDSLSWGRICETALDRSLYEAIIKLDTDQRKFAENNRDMELQNKKLALSFQKVQIWRKCAVLPKVSSLFAFISLNPPFIIFHYL